MNAGKKAFLVQEAEMQKGALRRISVWKSIAIAVSTLGIAMFYAGTAGVEKNLFFCIPGVIVMAVGVGCGLVLNLGLKNGRRNVEKIMAVLEGGRNS